jgi:multiple antibiotic resistance protein
MADLLRFSLLSLSAIFVIVDPVGLVPLFIAMTPGDSPERRRHMARRACIIAWGVLVAFAVGGPFILELFGVTLSAFKVAGGLLMLLTAIDMLRAQSPPTRSTPEEEREGAAREDISVVPLAMPLLAGPGSIATCMMCMSRASNPAESLAVALAITLTLGSTYVLLVLSDRVARLLGQSGRLIAERLIGLVLAAISAQFILDGVREAMQK